MSLLALSALIVLSPKWLALYLWAIGRLPGWGRNPSFLAGLVLETAVSAAIAPILMVSQARAVIEPFLGRDAGWRPQARVATKVVEGANYHVHHHAGEHVLCGVDPAGRSQPCVRRPDRCVARPRAAPP